MPVGGLGLAATGRQDLSCLIILIVLFTGLLAATGVSGLHIEGAVQDDDLMPERRTAERMHIVLSLYRESPAEVAHFVSQVMALSNVRRLQPRIYAYVKGGTGQAAAVKAVGFADKVLDTPNVGREAETYLRHILAHYEKLPDHIFFTQGLPQYNDSVDALGRFFTHKTGILGLSAITVCTCEGFSDTWTGGQMGSEHAGFIRLREMWVLFQRTLCPKEYACFHNGMFVVSKERMLLHPKSLYEYVHGLFFLLREDPLRHNEDKYFNHDKVVTPAESGWRTLAHVMERTWFFVFNCTDPEVAITCDRPCEGHSHVCTTPLGCQCLDE